jgi:hypothetical protein
MTLSVRYRAKLQGGQEVQWPQETAECWPGLENRLAEAIGREAGEAHEVRGALFIWNRKGRR